MKCIGAKEVKDDKFMKKRLSYSHKKKDDAVYNANKITDWLINLCNLSKAIKFFVLFFTENSS